MILTADQKRIAVKAIRVPVYGHDQIVWVNPSPKELLRQAQNSSEIRGILSTWGDYFFWPAVTVTHHHMHEALEAVGEVARDSYDEVKDNQIFAGEYTRQGFRWLSDTYTIPDKYFDIQAPIFMMNFESF